MTSGTIGSVASLLAASLFEKKIMIVSTNS
jgi:hypothetical protein